MRLIQKILIMFFLFSIVACSTTKDSAEKDGKNKKERFSQNERFYGRFDR